MTAAAGNQTESKKSNRGGKRPGAGRKPGGGARNQAFEGAERYSPNRGFIYMPLDPKREVTTSSRTELQRKARWLYNNEGFAGRCIDGPARYAVGTGITPQARTRNAEFNKAAEKLFEDTVGTTSFAFDLAAQWNFYEAQEEILKHTGLDGDFFAQLMLSTNGAAMCRFIGGEWCGNGTDANAEKNGWVDGVLLNKWGRPVKYRFLKNAQGTEWTDVPADEVIHFQEPCRSGRVRNVSALHRAVLHMHDMAEIRSFTKGSFKLASQIGFVIKSADKVQFGPQMPNSRPATGTDASGRVSVDSMYSGSGIPQLKLNEELQSFKNEHPGESFDPFMNHLARDIAWGRGVSPEVLWSIAGIGGANTRYVLADAQTFFERQQQMLINQFCSRFWVYWLWHEIEAGRLIYPGDDWWRHEWVTPRKVTVDFGRDTKAFLEVVDAGGMSMKRFASIHGWDEETEEDDMIAAAIRRKRKIDEAAKREKIDLTVAEVFGPAG